MSHQPRPGRSEPTYIRDDYAQEILVDLRAAYLGDDRPWVVGFSGGKDSTALLQLVYYMLVRLPAKQRHKPVFVLASDTRVEIPSISQRIRTELDQINSCSEQDLLPLTTHLVFPTLNDTFWVNLIGRGYPSPTSHFRWCTDRLKIRPASRFIKKLVDRAGSVVVVLGSRKHESDTRARSMNANAIVGQRFRPHLNLPKAWVYAPLADLTANEVWTYLLGTPSPWGGDNRGLVALYKQASGNECPLVIDTSTPSCGHSRFGCWTCTVVEKDHSIESLVFNGEKHLIPLLELRDYLREIRNASGMRYDLRRNGRKPLNRHTGLVMTNTGPFKHKTRREILRRLLEAQKESALSLVGGDELAAIGEIWTAEEAYPQPPDTVLRIWKHVYEDTPMPSDKSIAINQLSEEDRLLLEACEAHNVPFEMMRSLREVEEKFSHLKRRQGLPDDMRDIVRRMVKGASEQ